MATTPQLLTVPEAAERLAVLPARLLRWAKAGQVPCVMLPDGEPRFRLDDLEVWVTLRRRDLRVKASVVEGKR